MDLIIFYIIMMGVVTCLSWLLCRLIPPKIINIIVVLVIITTAAISCYVLDTKLRTYLLPLGFAFWGMLRYFNYKKEKASKKYKIRE